MACQSAWAAARIKNTYLSAQFKRLAARRGRKCAIIAVAHSILVIGYHLQTEELYLYRPRQQLLRSTPRRRFKAIPGEASGEPRALGHTPNPNCLNRVFSREKAGGANFRYATGIYKVDTPSLKYRIHCIADGTTLRYKHKHLLLRARTDQ